MHHSQGASQAGKTEKEQAFWQEEKVYQTWGKCYGAKASKERSEIEKRKRTEELRAFKKMSTSDPEQESISSSSSEEGEVWKSGFGELYYFCNNHSRKKLKQYTESFLNLDDCINANHTYEFSRSLLVR